MGSSSSIQVLHIDDEEDIAEITKIKLEREGPYDVTYETDPESGLDRFESETFDCIVSDYDMPEIDGLELLRKVRDCDEDIPFILYTGKGSEEIASRAISEGVTDYLQKSAGEETYTLLANRIENAVDQYRIERELRAEKRLSERIVSASPIGVVVHDVDGDVMLTNERATEILGVSPAELDAEAYENASWDLYDESGDRVPYERLPYARVVEGEQIRNERYVVDTGDGKRRPIIVHGAPLPDENGDIEGAIIPFEVDASDESADGEL